MNCLMYRTPVRNVAHLAKKHIAFYNANKFVLCMFSYTDNFINLGIQEITLLCCLSIHDHRSEMDCVGGKFFQISKPHHMSSLKEVRPFVCDFARKYRGRCNNFLLQWNHKFSCVVFLHFRLQV